MKKPFLLLAMTAAFAVSAGAAPATYDQALTQAKTSALAGDKAGARDALNRAVELGATLSDKLDALLQSAAIGPQSPAEDLALWARIGEVARALAPNVAAGQPKTSATFSPDDYARARPLFERIADAPGADSAIFALALQSLAQSDLHDGDAAAALRRYQRLIADPRAGGLARAQALQSSGEIARTNGDQTLTLAAKGAKPSLKLGANPSAKSDFKPGAKPGAKSNAKPATVAGPLNERATEAYDGAIALYRQLLDDPATLASQKAAIYRGLLESYARRFDQSRARQQALDWFEPLQAPLLASFDPAKNKASALSPAQIAAALPDYQSADALSEYLPGRFVASIKEGLGELLLFDGQWEAARAQFASMDGARVRRSIEDLPTPDSNYLQSAARRGIARSYQMQGEAQNSAATLRIAREQYENSLARADLNPKLRALVETDLSALPPALPPAEAATYQAALDAGSKFYEANQFFNANQQVHRALELATTPDQKLRQLIRLASIAAQTDRPAQSKLWLQQAQTLLPQVLQMPDVTGEEKAQTLLRLENVYRAVDDSPRALAMLQQILDLKDGSPEILKFVPLETAGILLVQKQYERARTSLRAIIAAPATDDSTYSIARIVVGYTYFNSEQNDEALREFASIFADERVSDVYRGQSQLSAGQILMKREQWADARDTFYIAMKYYDKAIASNQIGFDRKGELYDEIIKTYEKEFDRARAQDEATKIALSIFGEAEPIRKADSYKALPYYSALKNLLDTLPGETSLIIRLAYGDSLMHALKWEQARAQFRIVASARTAPGVSEQQLKNVAIFRALAQNYLAQSFVAEVEHGNGGANEKQRARQEYQKMLQMPELSDAMRASAQQQLDALG